MNVRIWILALFVAAAGAPLACGLEITGQIVDSSARPVEGAEVVVYEEHRVARLETDARTLSPVVRTDAQGRFHLQADVMGGMSTYIVARKSRLAMAWDRLTRSQNTLGKGHFLLVMEAPCTLSGQLVDADGKPVPQARVQALPVTSYLSRLAQRRILGPVEWFTTSTDAQGRFRFEQFAADVNAIFQVSVPGHPAVHVFRTQRQNACGFEVWRGDVRLVLPREGTIRGRVVNSQGHPVGGVDLQIGPTGDPGEMGLYLLRNTRSEPDGTFVFTGIPEGPHLMDVVPPEEGLEQWVGKSVNVLLTPGQTIAEVTVPVIRGSVLEVTALSEETQQPLSGIEVSVSGQDWGRSMPALTDTDGVARVRVPAGQFSLLVRSPGLHPWQNTEQIADGQTLTYQAHLTRRPEVTGRVLDSAGRPVKDAAVTIHRVGDHAYTDDEGRFAGCWSEDASAMKVAGPSGSVVIQRNAPRGSLLLARDTRSGLASAVPVADWSTPADLRLAPAWTLVGTIAGPNGVGIPAARVTLGLSTPGGLSDPGVEVLADAQGRFEMNSISPLPANFSYTLSAAAAKYASKENSFISPSGSPGATIDIGMIQLLPADLSVSGVVVDADGVPVAHMCVAAHSLATGGFPPPARFTATNERGEFSFRGLCEGPIRIQAGFANVPGGTGTVQTTLPTGDVRIVLDQAIRTTGEVPIKGKPLPSLADVSATLSATRIDGKPVLMCFMDIQQRPCRQYLTELAGRAEALSSEGIALLVVQVGAVNMARYETWLKQNDVTLDIHVAADDFATRQSAWGIKGLPWLILADTEHIVRAEGFPSADLDKALDDTK